MPNSRRVDDAFPHVDDPKIFSKDKIMGKIKRLRVNYRKAFDGGGWSGVGRIFMGLYDEWCEIWDGFPAVECVSFGVETSMELDVNKHEETINSSLTTSEEADSQLTTRLSAEAQLLPDLGNQELDVKKRALQRVEKLDEEEGRS
eukprot:gene2434-2801_t